MAGFFLIDDAVHATTSLPSGAVPGATVAADGDHVWVHLDGRIVELVWRNALSHFAEDGQEADTDQVRAPMPGTVVSVSAVPGASVKRGEAMMLIESMKLETVITSPRDGLVETIAFVSGASFERDAVLVTLSPEDDA